MAFTAPSRYQPKKPLASKLAFTPYQTPTSPPPGFYDPALDSAERAAERGYSDLQQDTERDSERANSGLITNAGRQTQDYNTSNERRGQDYSASLKDLLTSRTRSTENYGFDKSERVRGYQQMGRRQTDTAANQGVTGGGALNAAIAARGANQGREQGQADLQYGRAMEDSRGAEARLNMNAQRQDFDARTGYARGQEDLGTNYAYNANDQAQTIGRAGRELGFFGADTSAQKFFQATQSGFNPDNAKPSNEFTTPDGRPYRVIKRGNKTIRVGPDGRPL